MRRFDFPVSLDLAGRYCVVIGGGAEATDKAEKLRKAGARVQVVAEEVEPAVSDAAARGEIGWAARSWEPGDLQGAFLVIVTPEERDSGAEVVAHRARLGFLACVIDVPDLCDFANVARVDAGDLRIALSSGGRAPALLRRLREDLARAVATDEMARFVDALSARRDAALPGERSAAGKEAIEGFGLDVTVRYPDWFRT
jgi:precorrin-2 dehydrogenase/sirohydrochlorin ferrochelatase